MRLTLVPIGKAPDDLRFFIRVGERHAGGITVHSISGDTFSYGIAVTETLRRRGVAKAALTLLFERMKKDRFAKAFVTVREENLPSLALHASLGFTEIRRGGGVVTLEKNL